MSEFDDIMADVDDALMDVFGDTITCRPPAGEPYAVEARITYQPVTDEPGGFGGGGGGGRSIKGRQHRIWLDLRNDSETGVAAAALVPNPEKYSFDVPAVPGGPVVTKAVNRIVAADANEVTLELK